VIYQARGRNQSCRAGRETLVAEAAEAHDLAQRAAEPEAGRQDWLAVEEVAVLRVPEREVRMSCEAHDHTERSWRLPDEEGGAV
jgi:hypothetical protein